MPKPPPDIEPPDITIYGVSCHSRYGSLWEMQEMIRFMASAKDEGLVELLESLFYDSNNSYLTITLRGGQECSTLGRNHPLFHIAMRHISQFEWGEMCHGLPLTEAEIAEQLRDQGSGGAIS